MEQGIIQADLELSNAKVFNIGNFEVKINEEFTIRLKGIHQHLKWFSDNDQVLDIKESEDKQSALIKSTQLGKSDIMVVGHGFKKMFHIEVTPREDTVLLVSFDKPVLK